MHFCRCHEKNHHFLSIQKASEYGTWIDIDIDTEMTYIERDVDDIDIDIEVNYILEYYSGMRKKVILLFRTIWKELEGIMLN